MLTGVIRADFARWVFSEETRKVSLGFLEVSEEVNYLFQLIRDLKRTLFRRQNLNKGRNQWRS